MVKSIENHFIAPESSIRDAAAVLEREFEKLVLVVGPDGELVGTITDGDIRRAAIRGLSFDTPVREIVGGNPRTLPAQSSKQQLLQFMSEQKVQQVPLVDDDGRIVDIATYQKLSQVPKFENAVVIMAGGMGKRLRPLTLNTPKPMLRVGGTPMLEIQIQNFSKQGFEKIYIAVNYQAAIIKDYFGDGSQFGVSISYLEEKEPLGTAGALNLLPEKPEKPIFVMNGDIVTNVSFKDMLSFHHESGSSATMGVREHAVQIPYGVVDVQDCSIGGFHEKPIKKYLVNSGIYVLDPDVLALVPAGQEVTMPELFDWARKKSLNTVAFPIREYWLDIGRLEDYERAEEELRKWQS